MEPTRLAGAKQTITVPPGVGRAFGALVIGVIADAAAVAVAGVAMIGAAVPDGATAVTKAGLFMAGAGGLNLYFAWLLLDQYLQTWRPTPTITVGYQEQTTTVDYQDARACCACSPHASAARPRSFHEPPVGELMPRARCAETRASGTWSRPQHT